MDASGIGAKLGAQGLRRKRGAAKASASRSENRIYLIDVNFFVYMVVSMGRKKQWDVRILLPLTREILRRLDIATADESRTDFIRSAIATKLDGRLNVIVDEMQEMIMENAEDVVQSNIADIVSDDDIENSIGTEGRDWIIQEFSKLAEQRIASMHVTLSVGGLVISGAIIDGASFFEKLAQQCKSPKNDEKVKNVLESYFMIKHQNYTIFNDESEKTVWPRYIHLEDAKIYSASGGSIPTGKGVLWRGKISSIDGFSIGKLAVVRDDE